MKVLKFIWILTILTSFFGPTLSLPGQENIFAYRILLLIHLIGFVPVWFWKRNQNKTSFSFNIKEYLCFYAVWFIWAALSFFWADSKGDALRHIWFLFSGFSLIGFSVFHFQKEDDLKNLCFMFFFILLVFQGVSLWEHFHRYNIGVGGSAIFFERGIPNAFMGNPNDLATFLALYFSFIYCLIKITKNKIIQAVGLGSMVITFHIILLTRSRANLLALFVILIAMIWFLKPWTRLKQMKKWPIVGTGIILSLIILYFYFNTPYFLLKEKQMLLAQFSSLHESSSVSIRVVLLEKGLGLLKSHYFLGVGAGNVEYHMIPFQDATMGIINLHNWWGELLINYGVVIWLLYLFFFLKIVKDLYIVETTTKNPTLKTIAQTLLISFAGFIIAVTSSSTMAASRYMWLLFGVAYCVINIFRSEKSR